MAKCTACGKFLSSTGVATCTTCPCKYHKGCVALPDNVTVSQDWICPECKKKQRKGDNSGTPVKGICGTPAPPTTRPLTASSSQQPEVMLTMPHKKASASVGLNTGVQDTAEAFGQDNVDIVRKLREEMRSEFNKMQSLMTTEFKSSKEDRNTFIDEIRELKREMSVTRSCFNERMDAFDARLLALEEARDTAPKSGELSGLQQALCEVRSQLNEREQEYLLNDVVVTGFPEIQGENPEHWATLLGSKMGMALDDRDIVYVEREGPIRRPQDESQTRAPARPRRIIIRFARRATRDSYLQAARVRRGLTTAEFGVEGAPARIYVNERLTRVNGQLFAKAREECRSRTWKYCWSKEGRVYVRREHGAPYSRIRHQQDLERIFAVGSV